MYKLTSPISVIKQLLQWPSAPSLPLIHRENLSVLLLIITTALYFDQFLYAVLMQVQSPPECIIWMKSCMTAALKPLCIYVLRFKERLLLCVRKNTHSYCYMSEEVLNCGPNSCSIASRFFKIKEHGGEIK